MAGRFGSRRPTGHVGSRSDALGEARVGISGGFGRPDGMNGGMPGGLCSFGAFGTIFGFAICLGEVNFVVGGMNFGGSGGAFNGTDAFGFGGGGPGVAPNGTAFGDCGAACDASFAGVGDDPAAFNGIATGFAGDAATAFNCATSA